MSPRPVIITRPRAQAAALAAAVAATGRTALVLPLLEITPVADPAPLRAVLADLARYALVAFVSPNAIDAAFAQLGQPGQSGDVLPALDWPRGVLLAVLGAGSRAALARHGITAQQASIVGPHDPAHSDTEHLLAALDLAALAGREVLIVRGDGGRALMADAFRAAGARVTVVTAYCRSVPPLTPQLGTTLRALLAAQNDWIITSSEALRGLFDRLRELDGALVAQMQQQHVIVPHARIAATAHSLGLQQVTLTGSGDERLLAALQS